MPDVGEFVSAWVTSGKALMLEATESKQDEFQAAVMLRIESKTWLERPETALERLKNATSRL